MDRGATQPFRIALLEAIEASGKSRDRIVCEINEQTGRNLSKMMLDKYTCANPAYSYPSEMLPAFCAATGSDKPFRVLLAEIGCGLHNPVDREKQKIHQLLEEVRRIEAKIQRICINSGLNAEDFGR